MAYEYVKAQAKDSKKGPCHVAAALACDPM